MHHHDADCLVHTFSLFRSYAMICLPCLFAPPFGYTLAYMSMHESCLLVCHLYFNTMKLWTPNPNLHLSLADTTFCLLSYLFAFLLVCSLSCFFACHVYHAYLLYASFICSLHLFLPLLVCRFLVFAFPCTHMEWGCIELTHGLPCASKKGAGASMWI